MLSYPLPSVLLMFRVIKWIINSLYFSINHEIIIKLNVNCDSESTYPQNSSVACTTRTQYWSVPGPPPPAKLVSGSSWQQLRGHLLYIATDINLSLLSSSLHPNKYFIFTFSWTTDKKCHIKYIFVNFRLAIYPLLFFSFFFFGTLWNKYILTYQPILWRKQIKHQVRRGQKKQFNFIQNKVYHRLRFEDF